VENGLSIERTCKCNNYWAVLGFSFLILVKASVFLGASDFELVHTTVLPITPRTVSSNFIAVLLPAIPSTYWIQTLTVLRIFNYIQYYVYLFP
jgi:hypothetical protein